MHRALYRKWRPQLFADIVGQEAITTALENQIAAGKIGHAYMFTGTRGTGKTSCAKVFAKAVNCENPNGAEPCGQCVMCKGLEDGSVLDVAEIDAASNNGVDDVRDLRDETMFRPSRGRFRVYIIDEVHMLTTQAFNALLKTLEEPPGHVIFILATTEIHKVPATILSRCQRFDFMRISAEKIAARLAFVAGEESIDLTPGAADLIARLADGAMRDALSLLDTCAGVGEAVTEELVRKMAGVADKSYLFSISDAAVAGDVHQLLELIAQLRNQSIDVRRLCEELVFHYRNLLLALAKPDGSLMEGIAPQERERYVQSAAKVGEPTAVAAVRRLAAALDRMGRSPDPRIELELALIDISGGEPQPVPVIAAPAPKPAIQAVPAVQHVQAAQPKPEPEMAPAPVQVPEPEPPPQPEPEPIPEAVPPPPVVESADGSPQPFPTWGEVLQQMAAVDRMLSSYMKGTSAFLAGNRVLIQGSSVFLTYMRENAYAREKIKTVIQQVSGNRYGIGPYEGPAGDAASTAKPIHEETLEDWASKGVDVTIE